MKLWKMRSVPKMYVKYTKIKKKSIQILLKFDQISKKKTELHGKMSKGKKTSVEENPGRLREGCDA